MSLLLLAVAACSQQSPAQAVRPTDAPLADPPTPTLLEPVARLADVSSDDPPCARSEPTGGAGGSAEAAASLRPVDLPVTPAQAIGGGGGGETAAMMATTTVREPMTLAEGSGGGAPAGSPGGGGSGGGQGANDPLPIGATMIPFP